jgi:hypothetical protein
MLIKSSLSLLAGAAVASTSFAAPIPIDTCQDLLAIPNFSQNHYQLTQDLDCSEIQTSQSLTFSGVLDGNHHQIQNLTLVPNNNYAGLFQFLRDALIKNLTLQNTKMTLAQPLNPKPHIFGLLASCSYNSHFENVHVVGSQVDIQNPTTQGVAGMMVGLVYKGTMQQVSSENNQIRLQSSLDRVGGLFAEIYDVDLMQEVHVSDFSIIPMQTSRLDSTQTHHYGGVAGAIHESGAENVRVQNIHFPQHLPEGSHGFVFGRAESTWLHTALIDTPEATQPNPTLSVLGRFSNHVNVRKKYQIQNIHMSDRQSWPWFQSIEAISHRELNDLSLAP